MNPSAIFLLVICLIGGIGISMYGIPQYKVYSNSLEGEAELARAEQNRKIKIREAEALKESAKLLADAEIERAKGVAEANKIIGNSLKNNEAYLKYLWITGMNDNGRNPTVIYIPTEAGLPILEANRLNK